MDGATQPLPTVRDVARAAGVSVATVSRVMAGNYPVAAATRAKVLLEIERLDYTINAHARGLAGGSSGPFGVILSDITGSSLAALAQGVEREAALHGRLCLIASTDGDAVREAALVELMRTHRAAAVIMPGVTSGGLGQGARLRAYAESLARAGSRLLLCGRSPLEPDVPGITTIDYDNEGGAYAIAGLAFAAGHRRVLTLPGEAGNLTAERRLAGYRRAATEVGAELLVHRSGYTRGEGFSLVHELWGSGSRFSAVLAGNDSVAAGALEALRVHGVRCPEDVSVLGFDDAGIAADTAPPLTTVRVPFEDMGRRAVRVVLEDVDPLPSRESLAVRVIERGSLAAPR